MISFKDFIKESSINVSTVQNNETANTNINVAKERAKYLSSLGVGSVIELCVGPSLRTLEFQYSKYNIDLTGNDIDKRWKYYYPNEKWVIGDALNIDCSNFDAAVFAPPLSIGCTGKRCDYLSINEVVPSYYDFLKRNNCSNIVVLVLPGKTFSIKKDRNEFYKLISFINNSNYDIIDIKKMKGIKNKVTKYVDIYLKKK